MDGITLRRPSQGYSPTARGLVSAGVYDANSLYQVLYQVRETEARQDGAAQLAALGGKGFRGIQLGMSLVCNLQA